MGKMVGHINEMRLYASVFLCQALKFRQDGSQDIRIDMLKGIV